MEGGRVVPEKGRLSGKLEWKGTAGALKGRGELLFCREGEGKAVMMDRKEEDEGSSRKAKVKGS